jgi:phycoerythrocyanin alpha-cysteine-84 phycoviolobilin lyase/isomerase subunit PecF
MSKTIDLLLTQLESTVIPLEKIAIIKSLGDNQMIQAIPILIELLQHHHQGIVNSSADTLIKLAPESVTPLIKEYNQCIDQNVQAQIVRILANIGDDRALDLLVEVVGVEIANHCQGNVRRVAARGLGKMVTSQTEDTQITKAVEKLIWALLNTEDWALRYSCALSLKEIADRQISSDYTNKINKILVTSLSQESDPVVKERINLLTNLSP